MEKKRVKLASTHPVKCYGDSTILTKMKLEGMAATESLTDLLGPIGEQIPETFERID